MEETYLIYTDDFNIIEKVNTKPTDKEYHKLIRKQISGLEDILEIIKDFPYVNNISTVQKKKENYIRFGIQKHDEIGKMFFSFNIFDTKIFVFKYSKYYKFRTEDHDMVFTYNVNNEINSFNLLKKFKYIYKTEKAINILKDMLDCEYAYESNKGIQFNYNGYNYLLKDTEIVLLHSEGEIYYSGKEERDLDKEIEYLQSIKEKNNQNIKEIREKLLGPISSKFDSFFHSHIS